MSVIAPSGPLKHHEFLAGIARLRELGFNPVYSDSIFDRELFFAGSVGRRVAELHDVFRAPEVKAIICARGGYGANYLLPHLDMDLIRRNPKILCGYSDATSLLTCLHDSCGLIGFHGPMVSKDFSKPDGVHVASFSSATGGQPRWSLTSIDSPELSGILPGSAEGKLYGGCLSLLVASLGTPYDIQTADTILFIEDIGEWPYRIDRMLTHLRYAGKLEQVRGIVFGEMLDCAPPAGSDYSLQDVIRRTLADLNVPIAYGLRSGHVSAQNVTLPIGVRVRLEVSETGVKVEFLEPATLAKAERGRAGQD